MLNPTDPATGVRIQAENVPFITNRLKDRIPVQSESFVLNQFTYTCGARHLGHTTKRLSKQIAERWPASSQRATTRNVHTSIPEHLVDSGYDKHTHTHIHMKDAFKLVYVAAKRCLKGLRQRLLATAEAITIKQLKPGLCKLCALMQILILLWP